MLTGSCLCGAVAYEADATVERIIHCHCQTCRKTHGTAFSSVTAVPREKFRWTRGADRLGAIESSPGKFRRFCSRCGEKTVVEKERSVFHFFNEFFCDISIIENWSIV